MVDTLNVNHYEYTQTQEIKALKNEIIKTIRDLITHNPMLRYDDIRSIFFKHLFILPLIFK